MKVSLLGLLLLSTVIHAGSGSKVCTDPATGRQIPWRDDYAAYNHCIKQNYYRAAAAHNQCLSSPTCKSNITDDDKTRTALLVTMAILTVLTFFTLNLR